MININKIEIAGRITKDLQNTSKDPQKFVVPFTVACKKTYGEGTDFIPMVAYGKTGENLLKYCSKKGSEVYTTGHLAPDNYTDAEGKIHYMMNIVADNIQYVNAK